MALKALGLYILAEQTGRQCTHWQPLKLTYIEPMLMYCIAVNVSAGIADILNNFSGSHYEDLSLLNKVKMLFLCLFEVAKGFQQIKPKMIQMMYQALPTPNSLDQQSTSCLQKSLINLENPFTVGFKVLKLKLSGKDSITGMLLGSLVFQKLILSAIDCVHASCSQSSQKYFKKVQRQLENKK